MNWYPRESYLKRNVKFDGFNAYWLNDTNDRFGNDNSRRRFGADAKSDN